MPEPGDAHRLSAPAGRRVPEGVLLAGTGPDARHWPDMVRFRVGHPGFSELQIVIRRVQRDQQALAKLVMGLGKFLEEVDAEEAELRAMMTKVAA